jgi:hypothetical protein
MLNNIYTNSSLQSVNGNPNFHIRGFLGCLLPYHIPFSSILIAFTTYAFFILCLLLFCVFMLKFHSSYCNLNASFSDILLATRTLQVIYDYMHFFCCGCVIARRCLTVKLPYFSIDKAHLIYNAHPNIFIAPFDV